MREQRILPEPDIRSARPADLTALGHVFGPFLEHVYRDRFALPGTILLAEVNGRPAGAMFVSEGPPTEPEIVEHLGDVPMLHRLVVVPHRRRTGIASRLVRAAEHRVRALGRHRVAVGVDLENGVAARLYRHLGYREWPHGRLKTFREHGDDAGNVRVTPDECLVYLKDLPRR